ncbi:helix-turn-helix domain-containing protein [Providencia hangzhouensis]|uniref:helix-turn-helix domain-containing protein n=1 Tax=Providencia hangzhouensis TaxID=3031799 RepID=UPI0034DD51E9
MECKKNFNKQLGLFLRKGRWNSGLTGRELGKLMNISQQQISRYEAGITSLTVCQLHHYLNVLNLSWFDFVLYVMESQSTDWGTLFNNELSK